LKEYYDVILLQFTEKDETLQRLQTVEQNENKIDVVQLLDSPVSSSTIYASSISCENFVEVVELPRSPIYSPPLSFFCKKYVFNLCFENDNCVVSPSFEKLAIGIGSQFLNKMGYTGGGLGKNGQGIVSPSMPEMLPLRTSLRYDVFFSSFPTPSLAATRECWSL
jgi:hypothetical protein